MPSNVQLSRVGVGVSLVLAVSGVALSDAIRLAPGSDSVAGVAWPPWMHLFVTPLVLCSGTVLAGWTRASVGWSRCLAGLGLAGCMVGLAGVAAVWFEPLLYDDARWSASYALRVSIVPNVGLWMASLGAVWWLVATGRASRTRRFGQLEPVPPVMRPRHAAGAAVVVYAAAFFWMPTLQRFLSLGQQGNALAAWDGLVDLAIVLCMALSGCRLLTRAPASRTWLRGYLILAAIACIATPWVYVRTFAMGVAGGWQRMTDLPVYTGTGAYLVTPVAICLLWCWLGWREAMISARGAPPGGDTQPGSDGQRRLPVSHADG